MPFGSGSFFSSFPGPRRSARDAVATCRVAYAVPWAVTSTTSSTAASDAPPCSASPATTPPSIQKRNLTPFLPWRGPGRGPLQPGATERGPGGALRLEFQNRFPAERLPEYRRGHRPRQSHPWLEAISTASCYLPRQSRGGPADPLFRLLFPLGASTLSLSLSAARGGFWMGRGLKVCS